MARAMFIGRRHIISVRARVDAVKTAQSLWSAGMTCHDRRGRKHRYVPASGPPPQGYEAAMIYPSLTLTNNQSFERQVLLYAGPKEYRTLATIADRLNNNIDQVMSLGFFGVVSKALLLGDELDASKPQVFVRVGNR